MMVHLFGPCGWQGVVVGVSWCWRRGQRPDRVWKLSLEMVDDRRYQVRTRCIRVKAQRSGANDGDACGYRDPLEGVIVATLRIRAPGENPGPCGFDVGGACVCRYLLGGGVVELWFP